MIDKKECGNFAEKRLDYIKKYYDNADMMELFKVSLRTLQRWRDDGIIPFKKVGGKIVEECKCK